MAGSEPHVGVHQLAGPKQKETRLTVPHEHAYLRLLSANVLCAYLFFPQIRLKLVSRHKSYERALTGTVSAITTLLP